MNSPVFMDSARRGLFMAILMFIMVLAPLASAADSDGDGFDNSVDDCPVGSRQLAQSTETVALTTMEMGQATVTTHGWFKMEDFNQEFPTSLER